MMNLWRNKNTKRAFRRLAELKSLFPSAPGWRAEFGAFHASEQRRSAATLLAIKLSRWGLTQSQNEAAAPRAPAS
jgi:hypothetical protein